MFALGSALRPTAGTARAGGGTRTGRPRRSRGEEAGSPGHRAWRRRVAGL